MDVWLLTQAEDAAGLDPLQRAPMEAVGQHFVEAGDRVTWVHLGAPLGDPAPRDIRVWHHCGAPAAIVPSAMKNSTEAFEQARLRRPDLIVAQDRSAPAHGCTTARLCGLDLDATRVVTLVADPTAQALDRIGRFPPDLVTLARFHMEAVSASRSDALVFANASVADWVRGQGWTLPKLIETLADLPSWAGQTAPPQAESDTVTASVVITHYERPALLTQALNALSVQTDPDFELIIVDDGSKSEPARQFLESLETDGYAGLAPKIVRQSSRYLDAARNTAIAHASGSHVILLDDDNVPFPHFVATFRRAAVRSRADIVTCQMHKFLGDAPPRPSLLTKTE